MTKRMFGSSGLRVEAENVWVDRWVEERNERTKVNTIKGGRWMKRIIAWGVVIIVVHTQGWNGCKETGSSDG